MLVALLLTESWAISNIGWQWNALSMFQPLDVAVAFVGYVIWRETNARWSLLFTGVAASQLLLHAIYGILGQPFQITYLFLLNVTFGAELLIVAWRGLVDCGTDLVLSARAALRRDHGVHSQEAVKW
jgi:hypothetical protein